MLEDQTFPGLGKSLIVIKTDHAGLTISLPLGTTTERFRRTLSRTIFMAVGQPEVD